jgi:thiol-disulfide isomerase/thioredoxin
MKLSIALIGLVFISLSYSLYAGEEPKTGSAGLMEGTMMMSGPIKGTGGKVMFTTLAAARESAGKGPVVLFFSAVWCPTCRAALEEIDAQPAGLGDITVVVVDYDKDKELKKQYKIVYQHTFVQIDTAGEKIALWNGGGIETIHKQVIRRSEK